MEDYVAYKRTSEQWNMKHYHFHEEYEILLSLSENAEMFITDRKYPLRYGSLILLPSAVLHRSVGLREPHYDRYVIRFYSRYAQSLSTPSTDLLRCFHSGIAYYQLTAAQTERLSRLFEKCIGAFSGFGSDLKRDIAFTELLLEVNEFASALFGDQPESYLPKNGVTEILSYISSHPAGDLSLDALAARFFISKPHLCRIFKNATGFSPGEYIVNTRVTHARNLLLEGKSVREACDRSGFGNYTHFIRTFTKMVGISPGKYKKRETGLPT
ncbi:MAG: helix-turn-helix transcriptional regulator [Clostridia bacterium]|nr:helix-turn-helix transcriptional regulator [Clostridia bacterium]